MPKKIYIIAGEHSGDIHGANLINAILSSAPDIKIVGMGGELMEASGAKLYHKIGKLSVIGFAEVIKKLPKYRKLFQSLVEKMDAEKPDAVILIDYPGFNIRFAKEAKKRNIPVIYYISPQVWAWAKGRIKTIKNVVDKMLVFFEFEETLYRQHNINATFVGHPLVEHVKLSMSKEQALRNFALDPSKKIIALLPGSRHTEVKNLLPIMLKSACLISKEISDAQFILIKSSVVGLNVFQEIIKNFNLPITIIDKNHYDAINCCDLAMVASGTATLETAIINKPMVLIYKVNFLTWVIARLLIKIPYIGLVNVVAGKKIIPEFIQFDAQPKKISAACLDLLNSNAKSNLMKSELAKVKEKLGAPGANSKAAKEILKFINAE